MLLVLACPMGTKYHDCSWNLTSNNITGFRSCNAQEQSSCTSGCFCSDGTVLKDEVCSNISSYLSTTVTPTTSVVFISDATTATPTISTTTAILTTSANVATSSM